MRIVELYDQLHHAVGDNPDAEVRVVFHGRETPSFNLPASHVNGGGVYPVNIICEEPREQGRE